MSDVSGNLAQLACDARFHADLAIITVTATTHAACCTILELCEIANSDAIVITFIQNTVIPPNRDV